MYLVDHKYSVDNDSYLILFNLPNTLKISCGQFYIIIILHMRRLRHREVNVQAHTASKEESLRLKPVLSVDRLHCLLLSNPKFHYQELQTAMPDSACL